MPSRLQISVTHSLYTLSVDSKATPYLFSISIPHSDVSLCPAIVPTIVKRSTSRIHAPHFLPSLCLLIPGGLNPSIQPPIHRLPPFLPSFNPSYIHSSPLNFSCVQSADSQATVDNFCNLALCNKVSVVFRYRVLLTLLWLLVCLPHLVLSLHAAAYGTNKTVRRDEERNEEQRHDILRTFCSLKLCGGEPRKGR